MILTFSLCTKGLTQEGLCEAWMQTKRASMDMFSVFLDLVCLFLIRSFEMSSVTIVYDVVNLLPGLDSKPSHAVQH